jgi:hypothetical protein
MLLLDAERSMPAAPKSDQSWFNVFRCKNLQRRLSESAFSLRPNCPLYLRKALNLPIKMHLFGSVAARFSIRCSSCTPYTRIFCNERHFTRRAVASERRRTDF